MKSFLLATALVVGMATPAFAKPAPTPVATSTCTVANVTAEGQPALDCVVVDGTDKLGNDPAGYTVNENNLFGHSDWEFLGKAENGNSNGDSGLSVTGLGNLSGLWSVDSGFLSQFEEFMIVIKAGTDFAAYLFDNTSADGGTWSTAGLLNNGGQQPGLSHLTLYGRGEGGGGGGEPVPEPAALGLLGLGAVGVALGRRRRRA